MKQFPYHVSSFSKAVEAAQHLSPVAVVCLLDPGVPHHPFGQVRRQLKLNFKDLNGLEGGPEPEHVQRIISFGRTLHATDGNVLVHCWAGISRSTAATLILIADRYGRAMLPGAVDWIWRQCDEIEPNRYMLKVADEILELDGALTRAGQVLRDRQRALHGLPMASM